MQMKKKTPTIIARNTEYYIIKLYDYKYVIKQQQKSFEQQYFIFENGSHKN